MATSSSPNQGGRSALVFERRNYVLLLVSVLLITVGFVAMYLDGAFLGVVSLTVSPLLIVAGYALLVYAILWRSDEEPEARTEA